MLAATPITEDPASETEETITVEALQSVSITKTASDASPVAGTDFFYTIDVANDGPSTAFDVTVTDDLAAAGLDVPVHDGCRAAPRAGPTRSPATLGDMAPGEGVSFDVWVRIPADFGCDIDLTNTAIGDVGHRGRRADGSRHAGGGSPRSSRWTA